jgi:hypothetical protein
MPKKSRQHKARRVIILSARRMASRLLSVTPSMLSSNDFNDDLCERVRVLYERKFRIPDRLVRAYDLASLIA